MKNLDLNAYGVREMSYDEIINHNGGFAWGAFIAGAIAGGVIYDVCKALYLEAWEAVVDGAGDGAFDGMPSPAFRH